MLLNQDEIIKRNLVENAVPSGFRAAGYDLHVGTLIPVSGEEKQSFVLKPQGTVLVISSERVTLPKDVAGYATVKTRLCQDGILATNIGIIDPEYKGLVSSYLINFGKSDFHLATGDPFLRLAFHEFKPAPNVSAPPSISDADYIKERKREVVAFLSETFLDLPANIKKVTDEFFDEGKKRLVLWAPLAALFLALFVFAVTLGVTYGGREVPSREQLKAEFATEVHSRYYKNLEERLTKLEEIAQKTPKQPSAGPPSAPPKQ